MIQRSLLSFCLIVLLLFTASCGGEGSESAGPETINLQDDQQSKTPPAAAETVPPTRTREPTKEPSPEPSTTPLVETTGTVTFGPASGTTAAGNLEVGEEAGPADFTDGFACLGTAGQGVSCLASDGTWRSFTRDNSPLGGDFITDIDTCDDGTMLIMHGSGVSSFDGRTWREIPAGWGFGSADAVACAGKDAFWVAHFEGVSYFNEGQWQNFDALELAFGDEATDLVKDVAVDKTGSAWVITANSIASYDGQDWTVYQFGQGLTDKYFFDAIALSDDGKPWVAHSSGLLALEDAGWDLFENRNIYSLQDLTIDREGDIWVGTFSQGIALFDGAAWEIKDRFSGDLDSDNINQIKIDESGRVWIATGFGLHVYDGQTWHIYRMENADLVDSDIEAVGISGSPALAQQVKKEPGSLSGFVAEDGEAYAGAAVELCVEPIGSFFEGETPCSAQPFVRSTATDENGRFAFDDLPPGYYVIAVGDEEGWTLLTSSFGIGSARLLVNPGQDTDVGEITLTTGE